MTVPYTTPPTAVAGQPLAASDWNTKIRDSLISIAQPPAAAVYRNTAQSIPNNTVTPISWLGAGAQTDTFWVVGSPTRLTCPAGLGGKYLAVATPIYDINATGARLSAIYKNGVLHHSPMNSGGHASWYTSHQVLAVVDLVPGDYVECDVFQTSGGALNIRGEIYIIVMTLTRIGV